MTRPELPALSTTGRLDAVRAALADAGCDAMVVTGPTDIRWCSGFTGSNGALVITTGAAVLLTDSRYREQATLELAEAGCDADVVITNALVAGGAEWLAGAARVALDEVSVSWADQRAWADAVAADIVPTTDLVMVLRSRKDEAELARIRRAATIVDGVLADCLPLLRAGITERQLALAIDDGMRVRGASGPAYETIVAAGPNAALPHARPTDRPFATGDLVVIDAGALVDGYRSDMTRTFVLGDPDPRAEEILGVVTDAQARGVAAVAPGVTTGQVDEVCRSFIADAGFGDAFGHGTGHGVGLDIHELPAVRRDGPAILQPGHVITVEPGVYLPGFGGVRVEDCLVVTAEGCESLTRSPKDPVVHVA